MYSIRRLFAQWDLFGDPDAVEDSCRGSDRHDPADLLMHLEQLGLPPIDGRSDLNTRFMVPRNLKVSAK